MSFGVCFVGDEDASGGHLSCFAKKGSKEGDIGEVILRAGNARPYIR